MVAEGTPGAAHRSAGPAGEAALDDRGSGLIGEEAEGLHGRSEQRHDRRPNGSRQVHQTGVAADGAAGSLHQCRGHPDRDLACGARRLFSAARGHVQSEGGLTGAAHDGTPRMSNSGDMKFSPTVETMKAQAQALRRDGVDLVVAVMHADRKQGEELLESHAADLVLIPVQPSPFDVWSCAEIVNLVTEAQQFRPGCG